MGLLSLFGIFPDFYAGALLPLGFGILLCVVAVRTLKAKV
jgi:hypothetical protein